MLRFENETYLYALLLIPILVGLFYLTTKWRSTIFKRLGDQNLINRLMPDYEPTNRRLKFFFFLLAMFFLIVSLSNPQMGSKLEKIKRQGVDVLIALDVSKSMLAEDIQPKNRLESAKRIVERMIDNLQNDRVGLIVFAGNAYLQMPLTIDYAAAKLFLKTVSTDMVPTQGTAISDAIELAKDNFDQESKQHKALILITDGEDHERGVIDAAEDAADEGVVIYTMGIGSEEGAPIPEYSGSRRIGYKRDKSGNQVVSKLDDTGLKEIAEATKGEFFRVKGARNEINNILNSLNEMDKKDFEDRVFTDYDDKFQYFLFLSLIFLIISMMISERGKSLISGKKLFGTE